VLLNFYYGAGVKGALFRPEGSERINPMQKGFIAGRCLDNCAIVMLGMFEQVRVTRELADAV
jgi:hypothetical protein